MGENLIKAEKAINIADHIIYITNPLLNDKRLLIKALDCLYESLNYIINSLLENETYWKRIELSKNYQEDISIFFEKIAPKLNLEDKHIKTIKEIINLNKFHKKSPMEFMREKRVIILSEDLSTKKIDPEELKKHLVYTKEILIKAKNLIKPIN